MTTVRPVGIDAAEDYLQDLLYRDTPLPGTSWIERDWITADGTKVATGNDGMSPEIKFLAPWPGMRERIQGEAALYLMEVGCRPWTGGEVRVYRKPRIILYGFISAGRVLPWSRAFKAQVQVSPIYSLTAVRKAVEESGDHLVAIVFDCTDRSEREIAEFRTEMRLAGYPDYQPILNVRNGDDIRRIVRESLPEYAP